MSLEQIPEVTKSIDGLQLVQGHMHVRGAQYGCGNFGDVYGFDALVPFGPGAKVGGTAGTKKP